MAYLLDIDGGTKIFGAAVFIWNGGPGTQQPGQRRQCDRRRQDER